MVAKGSLTSGSLFLRARSIVIDSRSCSEFAAKCIGDEKTLRNGALEGADK